MGTTRRFSAMLKVRCSLPSFRRIESIEAIVLLPAGGVELALATLTGVTLILRSRARPRPLVPIDLLRSKVFALSVITSIASFSAQMPAFVSMPFYLQGVLHRSQVDTGLLMTPWPVAAGIAAAFAGRLADRLPAPILSGAGLALLALGLLSLALLPSDATSLANAWRMAICGLGFGFFQSPNNRTMLSSAPMERPRREACWQRRG